MADLHSILSGRLTNLKRVANGWTARCPACAAEGSDKQGNHLHIWRSGSFACAKENKDGLKGVTLDHNRLIRAFIYQDADPDTLASLESEYVDPDPKIEMDKVYPEDMLTKLILDYRYWVNRGISEETVRRLEGGLAPRDEKSKLSGYFTFPVRDDKKRIIGWASRLVDESSFGAKHKHLVKTARCVYPIHIAAEPIRATRKVILTEGLADLMTLHDGGMLNVLVLLGLNFNARVLGFLVSANPSHIIISTNADTERVNKRTGAISHPGQDAADRLRAKLIPFFGEERVVIRFPRAEKDWNKVLKTRPEEIAEFKAEVDAL